MSYSLDVKDWISYPYKKQITQNFTFLDCREEHKKFNRMRASTQSALNSFVNAILTSCPQNQISELPHTFKAFISYFYVAVFHLF
jgi:hypothetical protein